MHSLSLNCNRLDSCHIVCPMYLNPTKSIWPAESKRSIPLSAPWPPTLLPKLDFDFNFPRERGPPCKCKQKYKIIDSDPWWSRLEILGIIYSLSEFHPTAKFRTSPTTKHLVSHPLNLSFPVQLAPFWSQVWHDITPLLLHPIST